MNNPFKFGSVVDGPFFTNRINELAKIKAVLDKRILKTPISCPKADPYYR
jgi:hypothetical protein